MLIVLNLKDFGLVFQDRDLVKTLRHSSVKKKKKEKKQEILTDRWGKLIDVNTNTEGESDQASHPALYDVK